MVSVRGVSRRTCALVALGSLALLAGQAAHAAAPVARHLMVTANKGEEIVITLGGYDADGDALSARITSVPQSGSLGQLSQIFSDFNYEPKRGDAIASAGSGVLVTGSRNRVVYSPPANTNPPDSKWTSFTYVVNDGTTTSENGIVWVLPPSRLMVSSFFSADVDGWTVVGNGARASALAHGGLVHEAFSRGLLNHYVLATDSEIHTNKVTSYDDSLWYFVAPSKFLGNFAGAYGGSLSFSIASAAGDFSKGNTHPAAAGAAVVLDCATCESGAGIRLAVFPGSAGLVLDGSSKTITLSLVETAWLKDPKNTLKTWAAPTQCEMVEVLSGLTGVKILGDHTKWYESIALDNVGYTAGASVPVACSSIYY